MEKIIHHEEKPKRPIGQKRHPYTVSDYQPDPQVLTHLRRLGIDRDYRDGNM